MVDTATQLGQLIGSISAQQQSLQNNVSPNASSGVLNVVLNGNVAVTGTLRMVASYYASTSFVLDHPIQGELDSAVYALDGGYNAALTSTLLYTTI